MSVWRRRWWSAGVVVLDIFEEQSLELPARRDCWRRSRATVASIEQNHDVGRRRGFDVDLVQEEFVGLLSAENADALHQLLVLRTPFRREADATVPMYLLEKHHETEPSTSVVTAMLLLTDRRWRDGASRLARRIEESGFVSPAELDLLGQTFVAADARIFLASARPVVRNS